MRSQRSTILWATKGDSNTKFFHNQTTKRYRKNTIRRIRGERNQWHEGPNEIASILSNYYQDLFSTSNKNHAAEALSHIPPCINDEMNHELTDEFHDWEITATDMAPLKAPRPNRMPILFYQHFWNIVDNVVTKDVLLWLNTSILLEPINHTFLTLIPKKGNPEHVHEFRPINLCNVLYKIFSKEIANRLKKVLPNIILKQ